MVPFLTDLLTVSSTAMTNWTVTESLLLVVLVELVVVERNDQAATTCD